MPENLSKPDVVRLAPELEMGRSIEDANDCKCKSLQQTVTPTKTGAKNRCRANQVSPIENWLYLSGAKAVRQSRLTELGITCIVDCTVELPSFPLSGISVVKVCVTDAPGSDLGSHFDAVADRIEQERLLGGRVLVHCVAGVSRSPAVIFAYLIKHRNMTLRQAFFHVRSVRPNVRPNAGFFAQLIDFERKVKGSTTVTLVHDDNLGLVIPDVCEDELNLVRDTRWARLIHERRNFERVYA